MLAVNLFILQLRDVGRLEVLVVVEGSVDELALVNEVPRIVLGGLELEDWLFPDETVGGLEFDNSQLVGTSGTFAGGLILMSDRS